MIYKFSREPLVSEASHSRNVRASIIEFLKYSLLQAGSYRNVPAASNFGRLKFQTDLNYSNYKVYASRRGFWPWEQDVDQTTQPTIPSVLVNGSLVSSSTYSIDYSSGRIIFNTAKLSTDIITCNYPFREVAVYDGGSQTVREIDFQSTSTTDLRAAGAELDIPNSKKAHLPAIIVDSGFNFDGGGGYELGSNRLIATQDIMLDCYSDNGWYLDWIHDTLVLQKDMNIPTFDLDTAPPDYLSNGALNTARVTFPNKCITYPGLKIYIKRAYSKMGINYGAVQGVTIVWNVEIYAV